MSERTFFRVGGGGGGLEIRKKGLGIFIRKKGRFSCGLLVENQNVRQTLTVNGP